MNQNVKNVIIFLSGAAIGGLSTWAAVKKFYELKADHEIDEIRTAYNEKVAEFEPTKSSVEGELNGPSELPSEEDIKNAKSKSSIVKELNNKPPLTDYTKYFKNKDNEKTLDLKETLRDAKADAEEPESEEEVDEDTMYGEDEAYDNIDAEGQRLNGAKDEAIIDDRPPYEIDRAACELECSHYDKQDLVWYTVDNTLTNEIGEFVDEALLIGDVLDESGFVDNDQEVLYVRNDKLMVDFTIRKIDTAFND